MNYLSAIAHTTKVVFFVIHTLPVFHRWLNEKVFWFFINNVINIRHLFIINTK